MRHPTTTQRAEEHQCIGHKEGDWVIFTCPVCKQYQRYINCVTKQVIVKQGSSGAVHVGSHAPLITTLGIFCNS